MAGEMKVAGYSIDFKEAFHSASFFGVDIFDNSIQFLIVTHVVISIDLLFGNGYFL